MDEANFINKVVMSYANQEQVYEYLTQKYIWAEKYIYYYLFVVFSDRNTIENILGLISEEDQNAYSEEKAYFYLKSFEQTRLNIAVIIPTCNREYTIEFLLDYAAVMYRRFGIDLIIYDSSDSDKTKEIVEAYFKKGFYNVKYIRYKGLFDGFSLDHKIIEAYTEFKDQYEYIWMCRDGLIPVFDNIIHQLRLFSRQGISCIIVDSKSRNHGLDIEKHYCKKEDCEELFLDQVGRLQTLGMLIFSRKMIDNLLKKVPLSDKTYSLWQMSAPLHLFSKEPYEIIFLSKDVFAPNLRANSGHFWGKASKVLEQWAYRWNHVLINLPSEYENVIEQAMMLYTVDFHPFTLRGILEMRISGGLSFNLVKKYEDLIPKVTKTPLYMFYFISVLPKWLAKKLLNWVYTEPILSKKIKDKLIK